MEQLFKRYINNHAIRQSSVKKISINDKETIKRIGHLTVGLVTVENCTIFAHLLADDVPFLFYLDRKSSDEWCNYLGDEPGLTGIHGTYPKYSMYEWIMNLEKSYFYQKPPAKPILLKKKPVPDAVDDPQIEIDYQIGIWRNAGGLAGDELLEWNEKSIELKKKKAQYLDYLVQLSETTKYNDYVDETNRTMQNEYQQELQTSIRQNNTYLLIQKYVEMVVIERLRLSRYNLLRNNIPKLTDMDMINNSYNRGFINEEQMKMIKKLPPVTQMAVPLPLPKNIVCNKRVHICDDEIKHHRTPTPPPPPHVRTQIPRPPPLPIQKTEPPNPPPTRERVVYPPPPPPPELTTTGSLYDLLKANQKHVVPADQIKVDLGPFAKFGEQGKFEKVADLVKNALYRDMFINTLDFFNFLMEKQNGPETLILNKSLSVMMSWWLIEFTESYKRVALTNEGRKEFNDDDSKWLKFTVLAKLKGVSDDQTVARKIPENQKFTFAHEDTFDESFLIKDDISDYRVFRTAVAFLFFDIKPETIKKLGWRVTVEELYYREMLNNIPRYFYLNLDDIQHLSTTQIIMRSIVGYSILYQTTLNRGDQGITGGVLDPHILFKGVDQYTELKGIKEQYTKEFNDLMHKEKGKQEEETKKETPIEAKNVGWGEVYLSADI